MTRKIKIILNSIGTLSLIGGVTGGVVWATRNKKSNTSKETSEDEHTALIELEYIKATKKNILDYFNKDNNKNRNIWIPSTVTGIDRSWDKTLEAIKDVIGDNLTDIEKTYLSIDKVPLGGTGHLVKGVYRAVGLKIKVKTAPEVKITLQVLHLLPDADRVSLIKVAIQNNSDLKTITIPSTTTLSNNTELIKSIVIAYGLARRLTDTQNNSLSVTTAWGAFTKGTPKTINIKITIGSATDNINISVTHLRT